jgi:predicted acetyltransferase
MELVWPAMEHLPSYVRALEEGWSPNTHRAAAAAEELARIAHDPAAFVAEQVDREGKGPPVVQPDGSSVPRLPSIRRWMWDGAFCGVISLRWQPGTIELPPTCLGHVGYSVVPWRRGRGYATRAVALLLPEARAEGLPWVELVTEATNVASQRVIEANGGTLVERFVAPASHGGWPALRFRIALA